MTLADVVRVSLCGSCVPLSECVCVLNSRWLSGHCAVTCCSAGIVSVFIAFIIYTFSPFPSVSTCVSSDRLRVAQLLFESIRGLMISEDVYLVYRDPLHLLFMAVLFTASRGM